LKSVAILGSTGSVGTQAIEVAINLGMRVSAISANENLDLLEQQINRLKPEIACLANSQKAKALAQRIGPGIKTKITSGQAGLVEAAIGSSAEIVLVATSGTHALEALHAAIKASKTIALANKEALVSAGSIIIAEAKRSGSQIIPVDSEHSAIYQCLEGSNGEFEKILLTCSGGPFKNLSKEELAMVDSKQALMHPTWSMGKKITIDSSTLMNKGFEVIEASWLFCAPPEKIQVLIHPQSIVHSAVEFADGIAIAQMGVPDMRGPIQYALAEKKRVKGLCGSLSWPGLQLTFDEPDLERFPCLALAYEALVHGGSMALALTSANDLAVDAFLEGRIGYYDIYDVNAQTCVKEQIADPASIAQVIELEKSAKARAKGIIDAIASKRGR